ncbi:MAG: carboxymuconolactone decarboxylase family protein [Xanthobacteraceae bacterium]
MPKRPQPRLTDVADSEMTARQRELRDAIFAGPRGKSSLTGPFAIWLHAPEFGELAQKLGAYCRFHTALPPRLSEFAILVTASLWRAQYEWFAHAPIAQDAGVEPQTIRALRAGRRPKAAPADELALYDFIKELYRTKRVSERTFGNVSALLGDAAMVEFVGVLGYYALISMTLNVFLSPIPAEEPVPFAEASDRI